MYIFIAGHVVLESQFIYSFLEKDFSFVFSIPQLFVIICLGFKHLLFHLVIYPYLYHSYSDHIYSVVLVKISWLQLLTFLGGTISQQTYCFSASYILSSNFFHSDSWALGARVILQRYQLGLSSTTLHFHWLCFVMVSICTKRSFPDER